MESKDNNNNVYKVRDDGSISYYPHIEESQKSLNQMYGKNEIPVGEQCNKTEQFFEQLKKNDSYNFYCIDCKKNETTHASVNFGIFLCEFCAKQHQTDLGMSKSYTKSLKENWDDYQLKFFSQGIGGNRLFHDFIKQYELQNEVPSKKYNNRVAQYYEKKLRSMVDNQPFEEPLPGKDWKEKGIEYGTKVLQKTEEGLIKAGTFIQKQWDKSGLEGKIKGLFKKDSSK